MISGDSPKAYGKDITWPDFLSQVRAKLKAMAVSNKPIVLLTQTFASPTTQKIINKFKNSKKPLAVICDTTKGKGVSFMEKNNLNISFINILP